MYFYYDEKFEKQYLGGLDSPEINPHILDQLIFNKDKKAI